MKNNSGSAIRDYADIVNQPGMLDSVAGGFAAQANRTPNLNPAQRRESGFLTGFAGGLQGAANNQRADKLAEIEELAGQVAMAEGKLAFTQARGEIGKAQVANFTQSYTPEFLALNKALEADDQVAANNIMKVIATGATEEIDGFKDRYGEYSHAYGGQVFFTKDGQTRGISNKELFSQLPFAEVLGDNAREIPLLLSNYTNQKFQQSDLLDSLNIDKQRADIASKYAQTNLYNTQARGVETDTTAKQMEMGRPPVNKELLKKTYESNVNWINEGNEKLEKAKVRNIIYSRLKDIITNESAAGGSLFARAEREYKKQTGKDAKITEANNLRKYFFSDIKGVAGNPSQKEWDDIMSTIPSTEQNPQAALDTIELELQLNKDFENNYNNTVAALKEREYGLLHSDPEIVKRSQELQGQAENTERVNQLQPLGTQDDSDIGLKWQ